MWKLKSPSVSGGFLMLIFLIIGVAPVDPENHEAEQATQTDSEFDEFNIPIRVKEMLEQEGVIIADLKNDRDLRARWLARLRDMRGLTETEQTALGDDFYKVIVTNSLFRPLGYRKPKPGPSFELIATVIDRETGKSKVLLRSNKDRRTYYVAVGEEFAGAKVEKIEPFNVTLNLDGETKEFRLPRGALSNR